LNDLEWLFHGKMRFWPALLESEHLNVRNSTTSAILCLRCSQFCAFRSRSTYTYTADALFFCGSWASCHTFCALTQQWLSVNMTKGVIKFLQGTAVTQTM